jgi:transposase
MDVMHKRCAGLDVHKASVVACVRRVVDGRAETEVRTFKTTTVELMALADWLLAENVTCVAMEATGVYWKPVWHILSAASLPLILANAGHVKNVPGRKTDVNDATWLAELAAHGLIDASFVPPREVEELRTLMRTRKQLVRERVSHIQRIEKVLETANIKLDTLISDLLGQSGRAILEALIAGETDPVRLAGLGSRRLKASPAELAAALHGHVTSHHRFLLRLHLDQIEAIDRATAAIDTEADRNLDPFREPAELLATMHGIGLLAARGILGEIGTDMSRFPTDAHLVSWASLCPRNDQSAGKHRSRRLRKGGVWLKTLLVQCAWAAVRMKGTHLAARFQTLKARRGTKKAIIAIARSMLVAAYHMLKTGETYRHRQPEPPTQPEPKLQHLLKRLASLGYTAQIRPIPTAVEAVSF